MTDGPRYALGYAPSPGSVAWLTGSHWLGRCAAQLRPLNQPEIDGVPPEVLQACTAAVRQQGWQAPLVPAFTLAPGADWLALQQAVYALAQRLQPCPIPPLMVRWRGRQQLALEPAPGRSGQAATAALHELQADCQRALAPLGAPAPAIAPEPGPGAQDPTFHLPLTGSLADLPAALQARLLDAAQEFFSDLPPLQLRSLSLFAQDADGADFALLDQLDLAPPAAPPAPHT